MEPNTQIPQKTDGDMKRELREARHERRVRRIREGNGFFGLIVGLIKSLRVIVVAAAILALICGVGLVAFPDALLRAWEIIQSIF